MALGLARIGENHPFVGPEDPDTILEKLIKPSVMALPLLRDGRPILDVGTGVGLPGLPLALAAPARPVYLVEPRPQCIGLIHWLLNRLPPLNVTVLQSDAQTLDQHRLTTCQILTRAALDWPLLDASFVPNHSPILRWSGESVDDPPDRPDWRSRRLTLRWGATCQEIFWWGPEPLFHVKQKQWTATTGPITVED